MIFCSRARVLLKKLKCILIMNFDDIDSEYEYIVIGLGPVGALAALRLAQLLDEQNADSHKRILAVEAREEAIHCDPKRVYHAAHLVSHLIFFYFFWFFFFAFVFRN